MAKDSKPTKPSPWMNDDVIKDQLNQQCSLLLFADTIKRYSEPYGYYENRSNGKVCSIDGKPERFSAYNFSGKEIKYNTVLYNGNGLDRYTAKLPSSHSLTIDQIYDIEYGVSPKAIITKYNMLDRSLSESDVADFLNKLTTIQLSSLAANIRVDKLVSGSKSDKIKDGVYTLNLHSGNSDTLDDYFSGARESAGGFGIKSLNILQETSQKTNYSSSRYQMTLKMVFNSMKDLIKKRKHLNGSTYSATDVLIGFEDNKLISQAMPLTNTTRFFVGYDTDNLSPDIFPQYVDGKLVDWKKYLDEVNLSLFATAYKWDIDIKESGKIELDVHYVGYTSAQEADASTNILFLTSEVETLEEIKKKSNNATGSSKEKKNKIDKFDEDYNRFLKSGYVRFIKDLFDSELINFAYIDASYANNIKGAIEDIQNRGDLTEENIDSRLVDNKLRGEYRKSQIIISNYDGRYDVVDDHRVNVERKQAGKDDVGNSLKQAKRRVKNVGNRIDRAGEVKANSKLSNSPITAKEFKEINPSGTGELVSIPYFYFKDLIAAVSNIYYLNTKEHYYDAFKVNINIDFGEMEMRDPVFPDKVIRMNIGDFPISYDLFSRWFNYYIVKPRKVHYSLKEFIRDCVRTLILPTMKADQCFYEGENPWKGKDVVDIDIDLFADTKVSKDFKNVWAQYYLYSRPKVKRQYSGKEKDAKEGIIWFAPGRDRGIVKKIEFNKHTSNMLKSHLMVRALEKTTDNDKKSKVTQLREVYGVTVKTIGNIFVQTGSTICVQPSLLDLGNIFDEDNMSWKILGMGGYYDIVKASLDFNMGVYTGSFEGVWQGTPLSRSKNEK